MLKPLIRGPFTLIKTSIVLPCCNHNVTVAPQHLIQINDGFRAFSILDAVDQKNDEDTGADMTWWVLEACSKSAE